MALFQLITAGNTTINLDATNNVVVTQTYGMGMPPMANQVTDYALRDGGSFQRSKAKPRVMMIQLEAVGSSLTGTNGLHTIRDKLLSAVNPHRPQPVRLNYTGNGSTRYIDCYYEAGLEGGDLAGFTEQITLRLLAPDPYWYGAQGTPETLQVFQSISGVSYIMHRGADGDWDTVGGGTNNPVTAIVVAPDGDVYVGGHFTSAGGVAANYIAVWDGTTWSALGSGLNGNPEVMTFAPDGRLYVGGMFTTAGGSSANCIAVWDGSNWSTLGSGLNDRVSALTLGLDGSLYAAGRFTTAGGGAANRIARWDGTTWSALGSGLNDTVYALATGRDGSIYAGGIFTAAGGNSANYIARWTGSAWQALGSGMYRVSTPAVYTLAVDLQGRVIAGGLFTQAGGIDAANIAMWSGAGWQPLGAGFNNTVYRVYVSPDDGALYAMGTFTRTGDGKEMPSYIASWGDGIWLQQVGGHYTMPHSITAMSITGGDVYLGGNFHDYDWHAAGRDTITNPSNVRAYPVFTITGPGTLYHIINYTTGQAMHFNLLLSAGEVLTIDLRPGAKTISSNQRGNLISALYSGNLVDWYLEPGANDVSVWVDDATASATATFAPRYWSVDMVSAS